MLRLFSSVTLYANVGDLLVRGTAVGGFRRGLSRRSPPLNFIDYGF